VLVRHLLSHSSGLSSWEQPLAKADLCDWEGSTALLAAQSPWWEPGTASGYHALTYGHLLGEVMRRVSGMKPGELLAKELAGPLGADFYIGLPASELGRVARVVPPPPLPFDPALMPPGSPAFKTFTNPIADASHSWDAAWCAADIGAANGHGNARSVARLQSLIACGGELGGKRYLSDATVERIFTPQVQGPDLVLGLPLKFGLGWGLPQPAVLPFIPDGRIAFWGGWGGSLVVADRDRRTCFAYMMNRMAPGLVGGPNVARLCTAFYAALGA
jgi:CubicO group peptidase (beta-lactamase class C family)